MKFNSTYRSQANSLLSFLQPFSQRQKKISIEFACHICAKRNAPVQKRLEIAIAKPFCLCGSGRSISFHSIRSFDSINGKHIGLRVCHYSIIYSQPCAQFQIMNSVYSATRSYVRLRHFYFSSILNGYWLIGVYVLGWILANKKHRSSLQSSNCHFVIRLW